MKIVCIVDTMTYLTLGKVYEAYDSDIETVDNDYLIVDDFNELWWAKSKYFKPLSEIRDEQIKNILK